MKPLDLQALTQATLDQLRDATQAEKAITVATGLQGYDLSHIVLAQYPVLSPIRDMIPRKKAPLGSTASHWKVVTSLTGGSASVSPFVGEGKSNSEIGYTEADKTAAF